MQARTDDISLSKESSKDPCSALLLPSEKCICADTLGLACSVLSYSTVRSQLPWNSSLAQR